MAKTITNPDGSSFDVLTEPLSREEIDAIINEQGYVSVVIELDLFEAVDTIDALNDLAESRILKEGVGILADIGYGVVGCDPAKDFGGSNFGGNIYVRVTAQVDDY